MSSLSKTWITENIDSVVKCYLRKWLDIPISGTLSSVFLTRNKFGLNIYPPSVKFIQCQTVLRTALKMSPNEAINELWKSTSSSTNIQYDVYRSTKQVLKDFRSGQENKLNNQLSCQGSFFSNATKYALSERMYGPCHSRICRKIFSTLQCDTLTIPFPRAKTLPDGVYQLHQIARIVWPPKPSYTS